MRFLCFLGLTLVAAAGSSIPRAFAQDGDGHHYLAEELDAGDGSHHAAIAPSHRGIQHDLGYPNGIAPLGSTWYATRLGAWSANRDVYRWGNPWAFATLDSAATWLGMSQFHRPRRKYLGTYLTAGNNMGGPVQHSGSTFTNGQPASLRDDVVELFDLGPSASAAEALVRRGARSPQSGSQMLTLGVYTMAPAGQQASTVLVHLAVSRSGIVRGTFCDLKLDRDFDIAGAVDRQTGRVAWAVRPAGRQVFDTALQELTLQSGPLAVHHADGTSSEWTIAHYEPLWAEDDPPYDANPARRQQEAGRYPYRRFEN